MGTFFSREGVEEEPEERVGEVVLTLKGLRDIPDSSLNGRVRSLVLDFNPISRVSEPERLLVLTSLTELSLGICGLEEFPPSISQLRTLEKLSLSGNKLSIIPEGSLDSLSSLTELRLDSNALTVLPRISHLSRLKMLSADMNPIGDAVLSQLPRSLEVVRLSLCGITGAAGSLVPISLLHELRELDLSENTIANVPQQWSSLNKLQRLLLQRNRISGFDVAIIEGMTSLRRLDLGYNEVLEDVMRLPGHSKSLMWFCVSGNAFTDQRNRPPSAPPLVAPATSQECQVTAEFALPDEILPHIFLGSVECAWNKFGLRSLGVTHVLTVATYSPLYPDLFSYHVVPVDDRNSDDLLSHFPACISFINSSLVGSTGGCLIHCRHGVSRSATVAVAYVMATLGLTRDQAFDFVQKHRRQISPNDGFRDQLAKFEHQLLETKK